MRAIAYFSADAQEHVTPKEMERGFADYCRLNMHEPVATFASNAEGRPGQDPEYRRMVDHMRQSGSQFLVVVPSARHLGRDLESVARAAVELDHIGAAVACSAEEFPDLFQNAFQTLGVKGVSRTRARRIKESMRARAVKGQALGRPPFGYRIGANGTLEAVRDEATVVELIYRLYTRDGLGLRLIAQHLNDRDINTRRGGRWNVTSIRDILKNPAYTGTYSRLGMRRAKVHRAIIPPEVFRAAQDLTSSRRPVGRVMHAEPFLLSGALYCAYCGNKMMGVTRRQSWKRKDGRRARQVYRYYQCQSRNNQSLCGYHTWRAPLLEATVLSQLRYALLAQGPGGVGKGETDAGAGKSEVSAARTKNAERGLLMAMRRAARGETKIDVLGEYLKELDIARRAAAPGRPADVEATLADWESLDMDGRKAFIAEHVTRVNVEDERVEVVV